METFDIREAAARIGVSVEELDRLCAMGILAAASGIPMEGLAEAIRSGRVSFDFIDAPAFERFSALSGATFAEVAERTGVPVEQLLFVREAAGSAPAAPGDRMRDEELPYADMLELSVQAGFRPGSYQQLIRVHGDSLRRAAETESAIWQVEVVMPALAAGKGPDEILGIDLGDRMSILTERAVLAMYHLQQGRAWTAGIIEGMEKILAEAGLHSRLEHPPAMCFLDISGYTRLTQEQGDWAAAQLAEDLGRIVQRTSVKHGGRAVKWLGDGVMLHFPNPGQAVVAALEMVDGVQVAGLPPAHVGLHAGPVIFQEGDYYGSTVNVAARIAAYAQAGQVIVSQAVVDSAGGTNAAFSDVGPVELKGVSGAMRLYAASLAG